MHAVRSAVIASRTMLRLKSLEMQHQIRVMSSLQNRFLDTSLKIQTVFETTTTEEKLKIYALYKQATKGKNSNAKPPAVDFEGSAKWKAWSSLGNMSQEEAQKQYVDLVNSLLTKAGHEPVA